MRIKSTELPDIYIVENAPFEDDRGKYIKTFNYDVFKTHNIEHNFKENAFIISYQNVLRGLHYQIYPSAGVKLLNVIKGRILDVVVNIDKNSDFFGKVFEIELCAKDYKFLYVGKQYAHGFLTLSKKSIVSYMTSSVYNKDYECGVKWNSVNFIWPIKRPILSEKDNNLKGLLDI